MRRHAAFVGSRNYTTDSGAGGSIVHIIIRNITLLFCAFFESLKALSSKNRKGGIFKKIW